MQPNKTLELSADDMRALGYQVVDMLVEHFSSLHDAPVSKKRSREEIEELLREDCPEEGSDPLAVLEQAERDIFSSMTHVDHPRFFAYVPGPSNFVGAMADALVAGMNPFAGAWAIASGMAGVELVVVDWLRQICGMPASTGGTFLSGGSMANLTALAVARTVRLGGVNGRAVIYCSDQTHSSIERGARTLGFAPEQIRKLPSDEAYRLEVQQLVDAIKDDRSAGRIPFVVVANGGTTNTGAVDPLVELADLCHREGLWLHVDGAYGAAAAICEKGREHLVGLGLADSLSLDPHKWLFQPFECGCLLVRNGDQLRDTFRLVPEYLRDSDLATEEVNFRDWGVQLTRSFRAFKLWTSLKVFGLGSFRSAIERGIELAELAEAQLRTRSVWELVTPATLGIICFRYHPDGATESQLDEVNRRIAQELYEDGYALLSTTVLRGRLLLRLCTINPRTTDDDIRRTIALLEEIGGKVGAPESTE